MDVFVARSGGLAGIRLTWHVRVDEQPDAADWFVLIEEIPWDDVPDAPAEPDRFTWDIRCEPAEPTAGSPKTDAPRADAPRADAPQTGGQTGDASTADAPHTDAPQTPPQAAAEVTLAERQLTGPWRELVDRVRQTTEPQREAPRAPRAR